MRVSRWLDVPSDPAARYVIRRVRSEIIAGTITLPGPKPISLLSNHGWTTRAHAESPASGVTRSQDLDRGGAVAESRGILSPAGHNGLGPPTDSGWIASTMREAFLALSCATLDGTRRGVQHRPPEAVRPASPRVGPPCVCQLLL